MHFLLATIGAKAPRRLRREAQKLANGGAGFAAGVELEFTEQHQRYDGGSNLEVHRYQAMVISHGLRERGGRRDGNDALPSTTNEASWETVFHDDAYVVALRGIQRSLRCS